MGRHLTCITLILSWAWSAHAQQVATTITPTPGAGDLGTKVTQAGSSFDINGGTRPGNGPNLFHSFGEFSVGASDIANFANDIGLGLETANILSRVTGGSRSDIFGTIKTTGFPGADLFLLNPAGVVFGPSASLDVQGSFHVSTADFIELADGVRFDALPSANDALLTTAPPAAFGFLSEHPAKISFLAEDPAEESFGATFAVPEGETLSIVGGDIEIKGGEGEITLSGQDFPVKNRLQARGGRINLASLTSPGEVKLATLEARSSGPLGSITMQGSTLDVSEAENGTTGGGNVFIRGGRFVVDDSAVLANTVNGDTGGIDIKLAEALLVTNRGQIAALTVGKGKAGNVTIDAKKEIVLADARIEPDRTFNTSRLRTAARGGSSGTAGDIVLNTERLEIRDGAFISALTKGDGNGGVVKITARDVVLKARPDPSLTGNDHLLPADILVTTDTGVGEGGKIVINTERLRLSEGARLNSLTNGPGKGGNVEINASDSVLLEGGSEIEAISRSLAKNDAGNITIHAGRRLELKDGARIRAETFGSGAGGRIDISVANLDLRDGSRISSESTGRLAFTGDAGRVSVDAERLEITGGGNITTTTRGPGLGGTIEVTADEMVLQSSDSGLFARTEGTAPGSGGGGDLTVNAGSLMVQEGATISASTFGPGPGGKLSITAAHLDLRDGSSISSQSRSDSPDAGRSGEVSIRASDVFRIFNGSEVSVETAQATAGDITLDVGFLLHLRDGSSITTSVAPGTDGKGTGNGGDINIDPVFTVLDGGSKIIANALEGSAGNIRIRTDFLFQSLDSDIDASNRFGVEGNVEIDSPDTDVISSALELPESFLDVATLLTQGCAPGADLSRLVVRKYEVLPDSPAALRVPPPGGLLNAYARDAGFALTRETLGPGFEQSSACGGDG